MPLSSNNPRLKEAAHLLRSAHERRQAGLAVIEGEHLIEMYSDRYGPVRTLIVSEALPCPPANALIADAAWFNTHAPAAQGRLAIVPVPQTQEYGGNFLLLLEDVQDPGNVGTILRTAAAAGVSDVLFTTNAAAAWSPKVLRSAQGAHFLLNIKEGVDAVTWAKDFRDHGGSLIVTLPDGGASLYQTPLVPSDTQPLALVVGNEGMGVSAQLVTLADRRVSIPMPGGMESLNVAIATAVVLFEVVRCSKRHTKKPSGANSERL